MAVKRCPRPYHEGERWVCTSQFYKDSRNADGLDNRCKACPKIISPLFVKKILNFHVLRFPLCRRRRILNFRRKRVCHPSAKNFVGLRKTHDHRRLEVGQLRKRQMDGFESPNVVAGLPDRKRDRNQRNCVAAVEAVHSAKTRNAVAILLRADRDVD